VSSKSKSRFTEAWSANSDTTEAATWLESAEDRADRLFAEQEAELQPFAHVAWDPEGLPDVVGTYSVGEMKPIEGISARDARDKMVQTMVQNGASKEWAESRTDTALRSWDRGVRGGSIKNR